MADDDTRGARGAGPIRSEALGVVCASNPRLEADGWTRRFFAEPDRVKEATELYAELGYEVRAETLDPDSFDDRCGECPSVVCRTYVLIYTRKRTGLHAVEHD